MIEGLERVLEGTGQPAVEELQGLLHEVLGGREASGRLVEQHILQPREMRVFRLRFEINGHPQSVIVKRLKPDIARRNQLVSTRWLPAIGLTESAPAVLGRVAERRGACVWHVYDDLGRYELDASEPDLESVRAAVDLIARIHTRFAGHALLGEVRLYGGDFGIHFFESNVVDAICALKAMHPTEQDHGIRNRLLGRLHKLRDELPRRAQALAGWEGAETLLHGDLWAINVFAIPGANGPQARLIDWDHAAVGPATYDLSTFLIRFPAHHRHWVLGLYRDAVANAGWHLPGDGDLNLLFETHEYARFANRIIWPAIATVIDHAHWGEQELAEIDKWFTEFTPVLSPSSEVAA